MVAEPDPRDPLLPEVAGGGRADPTSPPFRGAGPSFGARRLRALGIRPEHLLAGDLDGDGHGDLAATDEGRGTLLFWRGGARGLAAEPRELAGPGWPLRPVPVPAELELPEAGAAGSAALAIASRSERALALIDLRSGELRTVWRAGPAGGTPRALAGGALDGAGTAGLALALDGGRLLVLGGERADELALEGQLPRAALVLAGGSGIVVASQDLRSLEVAVRRPAGLERAARIELGFIPRALVELDLDGDGDLELAVLGGDHTLRVFGLGRPGDAAAWLTEPERYRDLETAAVPLSALATDLRGNGVSELVVTSAYGLAFEVFGPGARAGEAPLRRLAGYAGQTPRGLAAGDFDADGALDLAVACQGARALALFFGDGAGDLIRARQVPVGAVPNGLAVLPGGPGAATALAVLEAKDRALALITSAGSASTAWRREQLAPTAESPRAPVAVDWDGDGRPEPAWLEGEGLSTVRLHRAEGALDLLGERTLRDARDLAAVPGFAGERGALLVAEQGAGTLVLLSKDRAPFVHALEGDSPTAVVVRGPGAGGEGEARIAVGLGAPGSRRGVALFALRAGAASAELVEVGFVATAYAPVHLVALDPASDRGALAVLSKPDPRTPPGAVELLIADPDAPAGYRASAPVPADGNARRLAAGDLDGDGVDELFAAAQNAHRVLAWRREGDALVALDALGAHLGPLDVMLADVDGDGTPEVCVANGFSDDVSVIRALPRRE